jgi:tetratricopeptide (TPR) repeat protein
MRYRSSIQTPKSSIRENGSLLDFRAWALDFGFLLLLSTLISGCGWLPNFLQHSTDKSVRLTEEARVACERGEHERARQLLEHAGEIAPNDPDVQYRIARVLLLVGDTDEAVKHLRYATKRGVDDPEAYLELARVLLEAHQYGECQEMIDSALRLVPTHVPAQLLAGRLAELRHKDEEALAIYYGVLGNDPSDVQAMLRVTDVLMRTDRTSQAAPLLRTIVDSDRISPVEQARAHWSLGLIYGREHRWAESATQLAAAADLRPALTADEAYQIAYAWWEAGNRDKAQTYVNRTLASSPQHANALALAAALRQGDSASQAAYTRQPLPAPKAWQ